ncbi:MAG: hypothetical protein LUE98_18450 [Tannerellaceae bacterium]|nr:hypothetical protein [Tannerellaceae bacterium]
MEKKYKHEEENPGNNVLKEPAIQYSKQAETGMTFSPPLTEEELKNAMTGDELREYMRKHIHALFNEK